jgi:GTP cyclohydrolase II
VSDASVRATVPVTLRRPDPIRVDLVTFTGLSDSGEHIACVLPGDLGDAPLVRVHSECLTGDVFGSARCDCGQQLDEALRRTAVAGGVILYLRQEGRGIGLYNKLDAYLLQDTGLDTFEANRQIGRGADERDYGVAAEMLQALGISRVRLLTNNPDKARQLRLHGIEVDELVHTEVHLTEENVDYLKAKVGVTGHTLRLVAE